MELKPIGEAEARCIAEAAVRLVNSDDSDEGRPRFAAYQELEKACKRHINRPPWERFELGYRNRVTDDFVSERDVLLYLLNREK